ncbi:MAG: tetratricopeptide repeat protein [Akkermansiaceae bacterium]|nr:tetratricopeptide repeat protein [Verrucomicrobiales bacterium]
MKRFSSWLAVAFVLCVLARATFAAEVESHFDAANQLYEQGRFAEAASAYDGLIRSNAVSSTVYFNLGNARFKAGEAGQAIAAYRNAQELSPRDPDLRANLQFVRNQIQGPNAQPDRWQSWLGRLTVNEWTILAAVPFWALLLLLTAIQLRPRLRATLRGFVWLGGMATVAFTALLISTWQTHSRPTAIVTTRDAVVRNGPLEESQSTFTVHDGAELKLLDQKNDWVQIGVGDRIGWLKREQVIVD